MKEEKKHSNKTKSKIGEETSLRLKENVKALPKALSAEENLELLKKYKETGDNDIRNQIVCGNLRLAVSYSYRCLPGLAQKFYGNRMDDLVQDLALCLMNAIEKFDASKGYLFSTFASAAVRNTLFQKNRKNKSLKNNATIVSFSSPVNMNEDTKQLRYEDVLMDEKFSEETLAASIDLKHILKNIVPTLSKRERKIFEEYFLEQRPQHEIAENLNLTQGHVSRLIFAIRHKILFAYKNGLDAQKNFSLSDDQISFQQALKMQKPKHQGILKDYFQGKMKFNEIAQKYDLSVTGVKWIVKQFNYFCDEENVELPRRKGRSQKSQREKQEEERDLNARKMTERNKKLWEDYLNGKMTLEEIAKKYDITISNVSDIVSKFEEKFKNKGEEMQVRLHAPRTEERNKKLWADYLSGEMSLEEIAKKYDMSKGSVGNLVSNLKKEFKSRGQRVQVRVPILEKQERNKKMWADYLKGDMTLVQIAKKYGVTTNAVVYVVSKFVKESKQSGGEVEFTKPFRKAERNKKMWADYLKGEESLQEIAKKYSVSLSTLNGVILNFKAECEQRGEKVPPRKPVLKRKEIFGQTDQVKAARTLDELLSALPSKQREIFESYQNGDSPVKEIANEFGVSLMYIYRIVQNLKQYCMEKGIEIPKHAKRKLCNIAILKGFKDGSMPTEQVDKFMSSLSESQRQALFDWKERKTQKDETEPKPKPKSETKHTSDGGKGGKGGKGE